MPLSLTLFLTVSIFKYMYMFHYLLYLLRVSGCELMSGVTGLWSEVNEKPITIIIHYVDVKIVL